LILFKFWLQLFLLLIISVSIIPSIHPKVTNYLNVEIIL
jgi:hypothetical protein